MGKGNNQKSNKESKKPKKDKSKGNVNLALEAGKSSINIAGKKMK